MPDELMFIERSGKYGTLMSTDRVLYDSRSDFQRITVFENDLVGRALALDNAFNVSTVMEAFYHEPMAHLPLAMASGARDVLIIGGGDFGVATHVLKHRSVRRVIMCELDGGVIEAARRFFPEWAEVEKDGRFELVVGDGVAYCREADAESFDAVIIDSTDVYGPAAALMSEEFYGYVKRALRPGGVLMQLSTDVMIYRDNWKILVPRLRTRFAAWAPVLVPIPFYLTGSWGLVMARKGEEPLDPAHVTAEYLKGIGGVKTLTPEGVRAWMAPPPYIQPFFEDLNA